MVTDPYFYLVAVPAVLIFGIGKGGLGGALGVVAVPMMSLSLPVQQAAAILLPILLLMDAFAVKHHYRFADLTILKQMLVPAGFGVLLAGLFIQGSGNRAMELLLGIISLAFVTFYAMHWLPETKPGRLSAAIWSLLSGFTSTTIHSGGAPASIYLLPLKLDKRQLIATMAVFFAAVNAMKLVPYASLGLLDVENILTSLILMPLAPLGVKLGIVLLDIASEKWVYRLCFGFLFVSGIYMVC
ncbi:hypothetical protein A8L45_06035 [Veronia pacifica]|uniref:Probable membrane transporter protein n=1 Tax=Veronia pacifica TaxID=1080227 RepID=A0A1C3EMY0_9GAMM|nr:hypothetical protein A8L45_06035 [Veronia pacifica]